jgi:hypothetical protein
MANIYMNSSSYGIPDQASLEFLVNNPHLSEEQRQAVWSNGSSNAFNMPVQPSMLHQVPRTMPNSMSNLTQLPVWISSLVVALPMF